MKKRLILLAACCACLSVVRAADLKESKFTQVVNEVQIVSTSDNSKRAAAVDATFKMPDVLQTGRASRAEMIAEDGTITRVGANTIFSFDRANRSVRLEKGSLLFNSPKGKGGGNIHTAAATAAVIGTTLIVTTTPNGGFKVLTLEGRANVTYQNGARQRLDAGQMTFVLPGGIAGPVVMFRLDQQVANSALVKGFTKPLDSQPKIESAISKQEGEIQAGRAEDTGLLVGEEASPTGVQVIQLFDQVSASTNVIPGVVKPKLPPGFEVPERLVFKEDEGGFTARDGTGGLLFVSSPERGTNPPVRIEASAGPADAALDDQTINAPFVANDPRVFRESVDIFAIHPETGLPVGVLQPSFMGFIGQSITISAPTLDLNQFAPMEHFDFLSLQDLSITGNLDISASQIPEGVSLTAGSGRRVLIASGTTLNADTPALFVESPAGLTLDNSAIRKQNNAGTLDLLADGAISLNNSFVSGETVRVATGNSFSTTGTAANSGGLTGTSRVTVNAALGMTIGTDVTSDPASGSIGLVNNSGLLTVNNGAGLRGAFISANSPGGIALNNATVAGNQASLSGGNFAGGGAVDIQNSTFNLNGALTVQNNSANPLTISASTITAGSISATSNDDVVLNNDTFTAANQANVTAGEALFLNDTPVTGNSVRLNAGDSLTLARTVATAGNIRGDSSVILNSGSALTVGVNVTAGTGPSSGSISLASSSDRLDITPGVTLTGGFIGANSADGILIDGATVSGDQASFSASRSGLVRAQNATFNLTGSLNADSRTGVQFDGATVTAGQLNLVGGDDDPESGPGAGPITLTRSTFDLTGGATIDNNTGILTVDNTSRITAAGSINASSPNGLVFNNATISGNQIDLASGNEDGTGSVSVQSSTFTANAGLSVNGDSAAFNNATLTAANDLNVQAGSVSLNNTVLDGNRVTVNSESFLTVPNVAPNNGRITGVSEVNLTAQSGGMTIGVNVSATGPSGTINVVNNGGVFNTAAAGKTFQAAFVNVSSPGGLLFDNTTVNSANRVNLIAGSQPGTLALVQNTSFTGQADVNIAGHTVVLSQVNFANGSLVTLRSLLGQLAANPNSGQQVQGGFVNYIQNVNYNNAPAQDFTGAGKPITIRPLQ